MAFLNQINFWQISKVNVLHLIAKKVFQFHDAGNFCQYCLGKGADPSSRNKASYYLRVTSRQNFSLTFACLY